MDLFIFELLHSLSGKVSYIDSMMIFLSKYGYILFILSVLSLFLFPAYRKMGLTGVVALVVGLLLNLLIGTLVDRPRPFIAHDIDILIPKEPSPSFPSDQALIAGVFMTLFWILAPKLRIPVVILGLLAVVSRIYVGHHYPSDVVTGALLGVILVPVTRRILSNRRGIREDKPLGL
ncbi:undecaprenyl-diphosphatase [Melghiribacillus thermohalophilus]|uniref:Undecaprenyl-diphosphatase n=1 Tax=Melghiribacillus thermohalophilus TaxID=1324956 RepID=A0A4R3MRK6_9BACI|nr:phosphatase PAP2 family protein [Melghiribacillus thermohalophilus]TCT17942.1 undecaprenyl-diphosphatase [Melghiribacillus thermohalophilus]